jgi:hypothetical protein
MPAASADRREDKIARLATLRNQAADPQPACFTDSDRLGWES